MFTEEDSDRIKRLLLHATQHGLDVKYRLVVVMDADKLSLGYSCADILSLMDEAEEIDQTKWDFLMSLPHWNPIFDLETALQKFIDEADNLNQQELDAFHFHIANTFKNQNILFNYR
jgi:hypothetical protein